MQTIDELDPIFIYHGVSLDCYEDEDINDEDEDEGQPARGGQISEKVSKKYFQMECKSPSIAIPFAV